MRQTAARAARVWTDRLDEQPAGRRGSSCVRVANACAVMWCRFCAMGQARAFHCAMLHSCSRSAHQCTVNACVQGMALTRTSQRSPFTIACSSVVRGPNVPAGSSVSPLLAGVRRVLLSCGVPVAVRSTTLSRRRRVRRAVATAGGRSSSCSNGHAHVAHARIEEQWMEIRQVHRPIVLNSVHVRTAHARARITLKFACIVLEFIEMLRRKLRKIQSVEKQPKIENVCEVSQTDRHKPSSKEPRQRSGGKAARETCRGRRGSAKRSAQRWIGLHIRVAFLFFLHIAREVE